MYRNKELSDRIGKVSLSSVYKKLNELKDAFKTGKEIQKGQLTALEHIDQQISGQACKEIVCIASPDQRRVLTCSAISCNV